MSKDIKMDSRTYVFLKN